MTTFTAAQIIELAERIERSAEKQLADVLHGNLAPDYRAEVAASAAAGLSTAAYLRQLERGE